MEFTNAVFDCISKIAAHTHTVRARGAIGMKYLTAMS
jgi:hypothetical protein